MIYFILINQRKIHVSCYEITSIQLYGDRPCELELLSDPAQSLNNGFDEVNYEDPNLNISIPVFAISGNHDDATGESLLLALDVLAVTGLINNFGKVKTLRQ